MKRKPREASFEDLDLPHFSKAPFWDCNLAPPDLIRMQDFVIERILVYGSEEDYRQLFGFFLRHQADKKSGTEVTQFKHTDSLVFTAPAESAVKEI
jgi:hypothetical protein